MSAFNDISAALDSHLNDMGLLTAWENMAFTPTIGTLFVSPHILPALTEQAGLGDSGLDEHLGIYQIDVIAPANTGKGEALEQADLIANHFKRGTTLTYSGVSLRLSKTSRGTGSSDGAWFIIPVTINYQSFTQPR